MESEGFLPARILSNYDVVFDYPHHTFSIGKAGSLKHRGVAVPLSVNRKSGFARVELDVEGTVFGLMVDTGATYSGMSEALISRMHTAHPEWPFQVGAVGPANMVGKQFDAKNMMLIVPQSCLDSVCLHNTGFVSRPIGVYEKYMSQEMSALIVGVLAGNALSQCRLELDYLHQTAYFDRAFPEPPPSITAVGIIVQVREDAAVEISGVLEHGDVSEVPGVISGDRLLKIDGRSVTGLPLSTVLHLLSGKPGENRSLTVLRSGRRFVINASVQRHLDD